MAEAAGYPPVSVGRRSVAGEAGWRAATPSPGERRFLVGGLWGPIAALVPAERRERWEARARDMRLDDPNKECVLVRSICGLLTVAQDQTAVRTAIAGALARPGVPAWARAFGVEHCLWVVVGGEVAGVCMIWPLPSVDAPRAESSEGPPPEGPVIIGLNGKYLTEDPEYFAKVTAHELAHGVLGVGDGDTAQRVHDLRAETTAWLWGFDRATPERYAGVRARWASNARPSRVE